MPKQRSAPSAPDDGFEPTNASNSTVIVPADDWAPVPTGQSPEDDAFFANAQKLIDGQSVDEGEPAQPETQPAQSTQPTQPTVPPATTPPAAKPASSLSKLASRLKGEPAADAATKPADATQPALPDPDAPVPAYPKSATKEDWRIVHEQRNDAIRRAVAAEDAFKRVREESAKPFVARINELTQQTDKLTAELERVALERSPKFQSEYTARQSQLLGKLSGLVRPDDVARVRSIMTAPTSDSRITDLEAVMQSLSPLKQRQFADLVSAHDSLIEERQSRIQQSIDNWQQDQQQVERSNQAKLAEARAAFESRSKSYRDQYIGAVDPEFDKQFEEALLGARNDFEADLPIDTLADMTIKARLAPILGNLVVKLADELDAIHHENGKLKGSGTDLGPDTGDADAASPSDDIDALIKQHGSEGGAFAAAARAAGVPLI